MIQWFISFVLMLYAFVNNFQSCRDDSLSSLVEPVLSSGQNVLLKGDNTMTAPAPYPSIHSIKQTEPLRSAFYILKRLQSV